MARPRKKAGEARDRLVQVRMQEGEYSAFKEAADTAGLDLSAWVRERLKSAVRKEMKAVRR